MKPSPIYRRRVLLAAVGVAAVVVVVALLWPFSPHRTPGEPATAAAASPQATAAAQGFPPATLDPRPDLSTSPDHVEVCGLGWVKLKKFEDPFPATVYAAADAAIHQATTALMERGAGVERAVGMYMRRGTEWIRAQDEHRAANPGCDQDPVCTARSTQLARDASLRVSEAFAREGLATLDGRFYAIAYYACDRGVEGKVETGDCARYSAARWAQLEPQNATPWLILAGAAQEQKDNAARDEALRRASKAAYSDYPIRSLFMLVDHPALRAQDSATRLAVMVRLTGLWAAFPIPPLQSIAQICAASAMADTERKQMCGDLARLFTENGADLLQFSFGIRIGERAGWPSDRVAALRERMDAVNLVTTTIPDDMWSCESMRKWELRFEHILKHGELANAERLAAATGRTTADLAREWRVRNPTRPARGAQSPSTPAGQ